MTVTADILRRLSKLRLEPDAFEEVLTIIADVQAMEEARRLQQRERVARHRALKRNGDVPVTLPAGYSNGHRGEAPAETTETVFSKSESYPPSPPKGGSVPPKKSRVRKPEKPAGTLCPENLIPTESHYLKCEQRNVPRAVADKAAAALISWSHENAHRDIAWKSDWPRALHRFVDDEIEKYQRNAGAQITPRGRHPPSNRTQDFWAQDAVDAHLSRHRGSDETGPFPTDDRDRWGDGRIARHPSTARQDIEPDGLFGEPLGADTRQFPAVRLISGGRS